MSEHTPGPWAVEGPEHYGPFYGEAVCDLCDGWRVVALKANPSNYEAGGDARLIAAAPDLLDALRYLRTRLDDVADMRIADEEIAKAKGEQG